MREREVEEVKAEESSQVLPDVSPSRRRAPSCRPPSLTTPQDLPSHACALNKAVLPASCSCILEADGTKGTLSGLCIVILN